MEIHVSGTKVTDSMTLLQPLMWQAVVAFKGRWNALPDLWINLLPQPGHFIRQLNAGRVSCAGLVLGTTAFGVVLKHAADTRKVSEGVFLVDVMSPSKIDFVFLTDAESWKSLELRIMLPQPEKGCRGLWCASETAEVGTLEET